MFKLSVYDYMNNFKKNILTIFQLLVMFFLVIILSSTILAQTGMFTALSKSVHNGKGVVSFYISEYELNTLKKVDEIVYARTCFLSYKDRDDKDRGISFITYNKNFSKYMQPVLVKGNWVDSELVDTKYVACVISENNYGIDVGDIIQSENYNGDIIELYVSGIIKDDQYLYRGNVANEDNNVDYTSLCNKIDENSESEDEYGNRDIVAITSDRQLKKNDVEMPENEIANALIRFRDDITEEEIEYNNDKIRDCYEETVGIPGDAVTIISLEEFYKNSLRRIRNILVTYVPIIFASIILIMSSILGYEYLLLKKSMTRYGVYYALGTKWQSMVLVPLFQKVVNSIFSVMIFISLYSLIGYTPIHNKIFMTLGKIQTLIILLICLVYISFGTFMAYRMIRKSAPDEILREAKVE